MSVAVSLLPSNATPVEQALSLTTDSLPRLEGGVALVARKRHVLPHDVRVAMVKTAEYGLGGISQFFANADDLLAQGVAWQRVRGTPLAVALGLAWLSYTATIEEAPLRRKLWNRFQLALTQLRVNESPDLARIEFVARESVPLRSRFYRGFKGYDVRAAEFGYSKPSMCMYSADSGARLTADGALWSFGRDHDLDVAPSQAELANAGVWIAPSTDPLTWSTTGFSWQELDTTWNVTINDVRRRLMASALQKMSCWIEFKDGAGAVIGYRRARAMHKVAALVGGFYTVGANAFTLGTSASEIVYVEALTDFGDGNGATAATAALRFGAAPSDPATPGALWLGPGQITLPLPAIASRAVNIPFGATVRERVRTLLRITA